LRVFPDTTGMIDSILKLADSKIKEAERVVLEKITEAKLKAKKSTTSKDSEKKIAEERLKYMELLKKANNAKDDSL